MTSPEAVSDQTTNRPAVDVDVLVVGGGITGIYQLYLAREAGFSVQLLEAGDGVGGTWYWNRYPGARFDSESYTYAYLFSRELFEEWEWQEHFAEQPEIERYLNHVVDRFDLRRHMRFGARVTSAVYDEGAALWTVTDDNGTAVRAHHFVAATGVLSIPYFPDVPGREAFEGESYHTGLWPDAPVDFAGKRVAVVGTGSSGVQIIPVIAETAASVTVLQRSPNWCTPLNNALITADEQAQLRKDFESIRATLNTSPSGFLHVPHDRAAFDDSEEERAAFFEGMWKSRGFSKLTSNYSDVMFDGEANAAWCAFLADKTRDGGQADPQGSPVRREAPTVRHRLLRGVQPGQRRVGRSAGDTHGPGHRPRHRDHRHATGIRHDRVGHRLRLRHWCAGAHGHQGAERPRAHGPLGRWSQDVSRHSDHRFPQLLLSRWTACRRRQQPPLQRRPGGVRHRDPGVTALEWLRRH
jgi:thioredoxin reductase